VSTFLLIRHAHHDWIGRGLAGWLPGVHLSAEGRQQAESLAERLSGAGIGAIYSSPLERALETAEPLSRRVGLPVCQREALGEVRFGAWEGRSMRELDDDPLWRRYNEFRSSTRPPGGELVLEIQARVLTELDQIRGEHPNGTIAVFSHGDVIKAAVWHFAGAPLDLFHRLEISPARVTAVRLEDWGVQLLRVNSPE
jgi:probable phosphoglycerate mutase